MPWALDFTPDNTGNEPFPLGYLINPYHDPDNPLLWTTDDWDPALRFWSLPYDEHLGEWLQSVDPSAPSIMAAREFGTRPELWNPTYQPGVRFMDWEWIEQDDVGWWPGDPRDVPTNIVPAAVDSAWDFIKCELEQLKIYMEDDRDRYLDESDVQADGLASFMIHFLGASADRHPWTLELINCGLAIGNIAYMSYKAFFRRVRPSVLRPGLTVPFGPPRHPAFPSGHSFLAHFIALLLLEVPGVHHRFGILRDPAIFERGEPLDRPIWEDLAGQLPIQSPLLHMARRIAVNRERIGVHYPSDSFSSRHLAAGLWDAIVGQDGRDDTNPNYDGPPIPCPTLLMIIERASAEWPALPTP